MHDHETIPINQILVGTLVLFHDHALRLTLIIRLD